MAKRQRAKFLGVQPKRRAVRRQTQQATGATVSPSATHSGPPSHSGDGYKRP